MSTDVAPPSGRLADRSEFLDDEMLATVRAGTVSFVRDAVERAGSDGVVVGLSGGVDSTLTAFLAVEALGSDRVVGLSLPCHKTDRLDANEARTIAEGLGIEFHEVPLRRVLEQFETDAGPACGPADPDRFTVGNATARLRMCCLYYAANARSLLVLGTANRTELLTGYFTKYGDGGVDLCPLGGLYKTEVRALARRVGVPRRIVVKPSTAGFWTGQTDADELGAHYREVDALLHRVVDEGLTVDDAIEDLAIDRDVARDVLCRCADTSHKRERPPVYRVGDRPVDGKHAGEPGPDGGGPGSSNNGFDAGRTQGNASDEASPDESPPSLSETLAKCDSRCDRDALFRALSDRQRRTVLARLYDRDEALTLPQLVPAVIGRDADQPRSAVPSKRLEQVATGLRHVHLPQLAGAGLVEYDTDRQRIRLTVDAERLRPLLVPLLP